MRPRLRPFEYMAWLKSVPAGARFDLTASGVADQHHALVSVAKRQDPDFFDSLSAEDLLSRAAVEQAQQELIDAVAKRYDVPASCVALTMGAGCAVTQVLMAFVRPGDHVIVERPSYEALRRVPENFGAHVSRLERKSEDGWAVVPERLAQLLTPKTRAVVLSNLHNPSGVSIDASTMGSVIELASRVGALVLVDEVCLDFCFQASDGAVRPVCRLGTNAVGWSSASKCFGAAALRSGWIVCADPSVAQGVRAAGDFLHVSVPAATTRLAARILARAEECTTRARGIADVGRRVVERWLEAEPRVSWVPPAAGVAGLVKLPTFMPDVAFADLARQRYETQVVPGSLFEAPGFVRLGFGGDPDALEQGLANLTATLDDLAEATR